MSSTHFAPKRTV